MKREPVGHVYYFFVPGYVCAMSTAIMHLFCVMASFHSTKKYNQVISGMYDDVLHRKLGFLTQNLAYFQQEEVKAVRQVSQGRKNLVDKRDKQKRQNSNLQGNLAASPVLRNSALAKIGGI